jgi:hypothetical protein
MTRLRKSKPLRMSHAKFIGSSLEESTMVLLK